DEMHEGKTSFKVKVNPVLGSGTITFVASLGGKSSKLSTDLSVRPPVPYLTLGLAHGLTKYLEKFPHGCTEQLVSQGMPAVVLSKRSEFGMKTEDAHAELASVVATLRSRQNGEGGFGLWASTPHTAPFPSVYALHFLTEARE